MKTTRYLKRKEIDVEKWDACVRKAPNGLIYCYSIYLDAMGSPWDALVLGDYEVVMPLPFRKKFGLHYIYQPLLTAQLGLFGKDVNDGLTEAFLKNIPAHFRLVDLPLNGLHQLPEAFRPLQRMNYLLPLKTSYETIAANYRELVKRNVKKAVNKGCSIAKNIEVAGVIMLAKNNAPGLKNTAVELSNFSNLYQQLHSEGKAITYGVYSNQNKLIASAVFLFSHHRAYYILVGNDPESRQAGASHLLIDRFIRDHAETGITLDFEGGDDKNLAFFYSSFGAVQAPYTQVHINRLPWYLKWLKAG